MNGLVVGVFAFLFLMFVELVTYWLVQFSPFAAFPIAVIFAAVAGGVYADAKALTGERAARRRAVGITALPLSPLVVWAALVWWGVHKVEAEMQFARIPAGCFEMGNPDRKAGVPYFEGPAHHVCLKAFDLGRYEVTQDEWRRVMIFPNDPDPTDPFNVTFKPPVPLKGDRLPVGTVGWYEAKRFATLMSIFGHGNYRLPTEAEWEYAARAGTTTPYYWGERAEDACAYENVMDLSHDRMRRSGLPPADLVRCDDGYAGPAPVGSYKPNPWGLYDMLGNAQEWVEDCWVNSYRDAPIDGSAAKTPDCPYRVVRGGTWSTGNRPIESFRVWDRNNNIPQRLITYTGANNGMRLARSVAE
jgi:formylglycine-generating enzyme required for sulfatase activity